VTFLAGAGVSMLPPSSLPSGPALKDMAVSGLCGCHDLEKYWPKIRAHPRYRHVTPEILFQRFLYRQSITLKSVAPGGMKTDFFTRSFDTDRHPAYDELVSRVMSKITDGDILVSRSNRRGGSQGRHRRKETAPLCGWCRRKSDLCNAFADGRRSFPQRDLSAVFRTISSHKRQVLI
jgi:hypothetical protein